jgi:vancomycin permeability regulator SanA
MTTTDDAGAGVVPVVPRRGRPWRRTLVGAALALVVVLGVPLAWVQLEGRAHEQDVADVGHVGVAIVLGAGLQRDGSPSPYLRRRLDAAARLWRDGKVEQILLTGDHSTPYHDEPGSMRDYLLAQGVAPDALVLDDAGVDTHASCRRAHDVYGVRSAAVITQDYHLPRAVFECRHAGIDTVGVAVSAASARPGQRLVWHLREVPASWHAAYTTVAARP